jgi:hypothetical protein
MPLIAPRTTRVRTVRHVCRIQEPNWDTLMLYARFIGDTADYVLNQLIASTIGDDRDFVVWACGTGTWRGCRVERARPHGRGLPRRGSPALSRA